MFFVIFFLHARFSQDLSNWHGTVQWECLWLDGKGRVSVSIIHWGLASPKAILTSIHRCHPSSQFRSQIPKKDCCHSLTAEVEPCFAFVPSHFMPFLVDCCIDWNGSLCMNKLPFTDDAWGQSHSLGGRQTPGILSLLQAWHNVRRKQEWLKNQQTSLIIQILILQFDCVLMPLMELILSQETEGLMKCNPSENQDVYWNSC